MNTKRSPLKQILFQTVKDKIKNREKPEVCYIKILGMPQFNHSHKIVTGLLVEDFRSRISRIFLRLHNFLHLTFYIPDFLSLKCFLASSLTCIYHFFKVCVFRIVFVLVITEIMLYSKVLIAQRCL